MRVRFAARAYVFIMVVLAVLSAPATAQTKAIRLAVMDFAPASTTAEFAPLGVGLQSMISADLGEVSELTIVERARLKDIVAELKLQQSDIIDKETAVKIGGITGASHLLVGSFTVFEGKMRLVARLITISGEQLLTVQKQGPQATFFELEQALVKRIIETMAIKLTKKEKADLQKPQTRDFEAFGKFSEGLVQFDAKNNDAAITAMQAAVTKDAGFALAAQKLAEFKAAVPMPKLPEIKKPEQCQQNPLQTPSCSSSPSDPDFRAPTMFMGDGARPYQILVHAGSESTTCITPCPLYLPKGKVQIDVLSPTKYSRTLDAPGGPVSIKVSRLNKTNIIIGGVLAGLTIAMVGATAGIHEQNASTSSAQPYWPVTLSLATGLAFPSIYYLLQMGKNDAKIMTP